jgi:hypothetical protein
MGVCWSYIPLLRIRCLRSRDHKYICFFLLHRPLFLSRHLPIDTEVCFRASDSIILPDDVTSYDFHRLG